METVNVYTIKELKEEFPEEYNKAFGKFQQEQYEDIPWRNELLGSFTKTFEMAGVNLQNYSLGLSQSSVRFTMPTYWSELAECDMLVEDYTGQRAKNWLKGAFEIHSVKLVHYKGDKGKSCKRYDFRNGDGTYWEGFTGYCALVKIRNISTTVQTPARAVSLHRSRNISNLDQCAVNLFILRTNIIRRIFL